MKKSSALLIILSVLAAGACSPTAKTVYQTGESYVQPIATTAPRAHIYKTNGNYNAKVAVGLNAAGNALISYPAPSDVSAESAPIVLTDGYLLDRRGVGRSTAFIDMDYSRYSQLKAAPSPDQLLKMIIPGAKITTLVTLPMTTQQALADTAAVNALIRQGLPNCHIDFAPLTLHL